MLRSVSVFSVLVLMMASYAQNLDEIITKCLEVAGQGKLDKVESLTIKAIILQGGLEIPMVIYQKRPLKYRTETTIQGMTMLQVYDGNQGYMINPFMNTKGPLAMESEQLEQMKDQAEIDNILMTYKNRNYALEYAGTEDLEGMRAYILKLTKPNKSVSKIYIDPENYVVIKTVDNLIIQGVEKEIESYPSNYKYVDGVLFPFKYEQKIGGQIFMQINFESFELNTNPPDSLFIVPAMDMQKP